jgi:hypothetical protein
VKTNQRGAREKTYGEDEGYIENVCEKLKERDHMDDLGVDRRII